MTYKRVINTCRETLQLIEAPAPLDVRAWLVEQARNTSYFLLAHADDGVIWGKVTDGVLMTARDAAAGTENETIVKDVCPLLREETLQSARLFNEAGEVLLWRDVDSNKWRARTIYAVTDSEAADFVEAIDEPYLLWGNRAKRVSADFTLLWDNGQGLRHVVPLPAAIEGEQRLRSYVRLWVRHLVKEDEAGFARITASRLSGLEGW